MGNLKARIKATLFRRPSSIRLSPSPSKSSLGQDDASSANTHIRPGHDAPEERTFGRFRGRNRGLSQDQIRRKSNLVETDDDKNSAAADSCLQTPILTPDADATAYYLIDRPQDDEPSDNLPQAQCIKGDFQADGAERSMIPASSSLGPGLGPGPCPRPAQAHDSSSLQEKASANAGPLIIHPDLASTPNSNATTGPGNDRHNLGASSGTSTSSTHSRAHSTAVTTSAAAAAATALAEALAPALAAAAAAAAPTNLAPPATNGPPTRTGTGTGNSTNAKANNTTNTITTIGITKTGTTLPSIDSPSATPPTLPFAHLELKPEPESALPEQSREQPRAPIIEIEQQDDTLGPIYSSINSPIYSPVASIPQSPSLFPSPIASPLKPVFSPTSFSRPFGGLRRQSILPTHQTNIARALLNGQLHDLELDETDQLDPLSSMTTRKIWVKRPMASATIITINEDDLVDDVREHILRKYANSLGRQYDAPDLTLRICNREQQSSRPLQPDEPIAKVIDTYYANGQSVDDALLVDIPSRRTPKASPNPRFYTDDRPHESGTDYFPPFQPTAHTHHPASTGLLHGPHAFHFPPSMSIVAGSQLPPLPSPGSARRQMLNRPNMQRTHTVSPVSSLVNPHPSQTVPPPTGTHKYSRSAHSRTHSAASSDQANHTPAAPTLPTPPPVERTATPPPRVASPLSSVRMKKKRAMEPPSLPPGLFDIAVPPINILIVEDNMINLRLLEAFVKRLKVRWQTAVNGKEAVDKWRAGGFHLVLMDIQLPIMNGLEATREIRRIEKANSIGVFSSSASSPPDEVLPEPAEEDKLVNTEMFKSPVIIVALTASSLQSDRHEALAAGCNDFLTKPVNFDWLQRKVKEWGCMQALIDFDGWRKWKDFSQKTQALDAAKKTAAASKMKPVKKTRVSTTAAA